MQSVIDLGTELLVDRSRFSNPQLQLLLCAIGQPVAQGSQWIAVQKRVAAVYQLTAHFITASATKRPTLAA